MDNGRNPFVPTDRNRTAEPEAPPSLNLVDVMKPAPADKPAEKPADRPQVPAPAREGEAVRPVERSEPPAPAARPITRDQLLAEQTAGLAVQNYMRLTENGTKPASKEQFDQVKAAFDKALTDARAIDPRTLQAFEAQAQLELQAAIPDAAKQREALARLITVDSSLQAALEALTPQKQQEYLQLEQKFGTDMHKLETDLQQLQLRLGHNPALFQQEARKLQEQAARLADKLFEDKGKLSPELEQALKAQKEFLAKPEGAAAVRFMQEMQEVDRLRHSSAMIAFTYAQILDKQGGEENRRLAADQLKEAVKDEKVASIIDNTTLGMELALRLGVNTPAMAALEQETARVFPELVPFRKAQELLVDQSKDPATRFAEAQKFFEEALALTDREGADARKVEDLRKQAAQIEEKLKDAQKAIKMRQRADFTEDEKKDLQQMQVLIEQANNVSLIRLQYALALNEYGHKHSNETAKQKAIEVLKSIEQVDEQTFKSSPEIQGALRQAEQNRKIDLSTAVSQALTGAALDTLRATEGGGAVDFLLPGLQPGVTAALRPAGQRPSDIPLVGPVLFGDRKPTEDAVVRQLAAAYLNNPDATQRAVAQQVEGGRGALQNFATDGGAIAVGFLTKYGVDRLLTKGPGWTKPVGLLVGLAGAGATKDYLADGQMGTTTDWLRGAGMFGGSHLLVRGLAMNPSRQVLAASTTEGIGARLGVEGLAGSNTALRLSEQVLKANAGGSWLRRSASYLNPLNYTGLGWQNGGLRYVGFGGQRTAAYLADGTMGFAQYNARRAIGSLGNTFGTAYMFGAGREALYMGTGERMPDGTPYSLESALGQINNSGLQAGLTASIMLPAAGWTLRLLPGGRPLLDGTGRLAGAISPQALPFLGAAAGPGLQQLDRFNSANRLEDLSSQARKLAEEARQKALEDLERKQGRR